MSPAGCIFAGRVNDGPGLGVDLFFGGAVSPPPPTHTPPRKNRSSRRRCGQPLPWCFLTAEGVIGPLFLRLPCGAARGAQPGPGPQRLHGAPRLAAAFTALLLSPPAGGSGATPRSPAAAGARVGFVRRLFGLSRPAGSGLLGSSWGLGGEGGGGAGMKRRNGCSSSLPGREVSGGFFAHLHGPWVGEGGLSRRGDAAPELLSLHLGAKTWVKLGARLLPERCPPMGS